MPLHVLARPPPCALIPRQRASAFNQPLSFNTSRVKTMSQMFNVRSSRARITPVAASPCITCSLLSTRQRASAFNQPLSFDTSKVTNMQSMFEVRHNHILQQSIPTTVGACTLLARSSRRS